MLLRPAYLSQKLDRLLPTKDGGILRTIRDGCNYMTGTSLRERVPISALIAQPVSRND
jgi:hypothetical protein